MAYSYAGSGQNHYSDTYPISGHPATLAAWVYPNSVSGALVVMETTQDHAQRDAFLLETNGTVLEAGILTNGYGYHHSDITGVSTGAWQHMGGVFASSISRTVYLDGTAGTAETTTNALSGSLDNARTMVGSGWWDGSVTRYYPGRIAEAAIWNRALSGAEMAALAKGYAPTWFRRGLKWYMPLTRLATEQYGATITQTGSPTVLAHPPKIIYPRPKAFLFVAGAAPPAGANPKGAFGLALRGPLRRVV